MTPSEFQDQQRNVTERQRELEKRTHAKHTPGPWVKVNGMLTGGDSTDVVAANLGLGLGSDSGDGVRVANARLIAAAPELLAALQEAVRFGGLYPDLKAEFEAVIAKATQ